VANEALSKKPSPIMARGRHADTIRLRIVLMRIHGKGKEKGYADCYIHRKIGRLQRNATLHASKEKGEKSLLAKPEVLDSWWRRGKVQAPEGKTEGCGDTRQTIRVPGAGADRGTKTRSCNSWVGQERKRGANGAQEEGIVGLLTKERKAVRERIVNDQRDAKAAGRGLRKKNKGTGGRGSI